MGHRSKKSRYCTLYKRRVSALPLGGWVGVVAASSTIGSNHQPKFTALNANKNLKKETFRKSQLAFKDKTTESTTAVQQYNSYLRLFYVHSEICLNNAISFCIRVLLFQTLTCGMYTETVRTDRTQMFSTRGCLHDRQKLQR